MTNDLLELRLRRLARGPVKQPTAVVLSTSPLTVRVGGAAVPAVDGTGGELILCGDVVVLDTTQGVRRVTGLATARPTVGTVVGTSSSTVNVNVGGQVMALAWAGSQPSVGRTVAIVWAASGSYVTSLSAITQPPQPAAAPTSGPGVPMPAAPPATPRYDIVAKAVAIQSAEGSSWSTDPIAATSAMQGHQAGASVADRTGFCFYGSPFAGKPGRTCYAATLHLKRAPAFGATGSVAAHLRLHAAATPGATAPALLSDATDSQLFAQGDELDVALPVSWGQKLLDGTAAGVAVTYSGTTDAAEWLGVFDLAAAGQITLTIQEG